MTWVVALMGCTEGDASSADDGVDSGDSGATTDDGIPDEPALDSFSERMESGPQGWIRAEFEVPPGAVSFQITARSEAGLVRVEQLIDPDGETVLHASDWLGEPRALTQSFYLFRPIMAFDWPIRGIDGPLVPGTWTIRLAHADAIERPVADAVDFTVNTKFDPDPETARIGVQIVYAEGVDETPGVVDAVEGAVERWRTIWGRKGIELVEHYETSRIDPDGTFVFLGDGKIENVAERKDAGELQLVVTEAVAGDPLVLGLAAAIPGTVEPSPHTFVVLSWLSHAGIDGAFTDDEISTMGETMAHEVGHYIGLFHPVEFDYASWDALDDTEECTAQLACESALGRNLMFPYPLCSFGGCEAQGQLTDDQTEVLHQQVSAL